MHTYEVITGRRGKWWWIEIPEVPQGFSQSATFDNVESLAREVISLLLEVPEHSFDVRVTLQDLDSRWLTTCPTCPASGPQVYVADQHPTVCVWMMHNLHRCAEHDELLLPAETACPYPNAPDDSKDPHNRLGAASQDDEDQQFHAAMRTRRRVDTPKKT